MCGTGALQSLCNIYIHFNNHFNVFTIKIENNGSWPWDTKCKMDD